MKITDLKEGMTINSFRKGDGIILKITTRTITVKYKNSTTKVTLRSADVDFSHNDL